jgi:glycosyltransferase involved in cell wall biosynthesis
MATFEILISTKNRCDDLLFTLNKIYPLLNSDVTCVVYDDGSTDSTSEVVRQLFPQIKLKTNSHSKGYIYCRNILLNETQAKFAISLDDDANFIGDNPLELIAKYFSENPNCAVIAARILWTKDNVVFIESNDKTSVVKGYVGCGHIWRMDAWKAIPDYPEWYEFYGEESFASLQLFKMKWQVHYLPDVLVQHRVDLVERTFNKSDFTFRLRRSLRSGWFNYVLFFPISKAVKCLSYSIIMQFKMKVFKGDLKTIKPLFLALFDLIIYFPKLLQHRNVLNKQEYENYLKLKEEKIYWVPEK